MRVVTSAIGEASTSRVTVGVGHEGVEAGPRIEEARVEGALASEAMDVDTTGAGLTCVCHS